MAHKKPKLTESQAARWTAFIERADPASVISKDGMLKEEILEIGYLIRHVFGLFQEETTNGSIVAGAANLHDLEFDIIPDKE
jgi:hypothetical protein